MIQHFIHWLGATPLSQTIQSVFWVVPTVQVVHILSISVVMASMSMFDLRLLGLVGKRHSIASLSARFLPWLWGALIVLLLSGSILIIGEPERSLDHSVFKIKMCLLAAAIIVTLSFQSLLKRDLARGNTDLAASHAAAAKLTGIVSLILWVGIVTCGRLIAYTS